MNTNDSKECRVLKSKSSDSNHNNSGKNNGNTKSFSIKKSRVISTALEIKVKIQQTELTAVIYTDSALSYINEDIVHRVKLNKCPVKKKIFVTVNGNPINSEKEVEFKIKRQADNCNKYKVQARIIHTKVLISFLE